MHHRYVRPALSILLALILTMCLSGRVVADISGLAGNTIVLKFSDPVLAGSLINIDGSVSYVDNAATAVYNISPDGSTLTWGTADGDFDPDYSTLSFIGGTIPSNYSDPSHPFDVGTLAYTNGTSYTPTLIFGATLNFFAVDGDGNETPIGMSTVSIVTTANLAVPGSEAHDADYIAISGLANQTFNVYEAATATAHVNGYIDDLVLTSLSDASSGGFIGNGQAPVVPEPSSLALATIGVLGGLVMTRRRKVRIR